MPRHEHAVHVSVVIVTTDEGEAGIDRYVGLAVGNELGAKPGMTKDDVLEWLATSTIYGRHDANQDGFADLDRASIHTFVDEVRKTH